MEEKVYQTYLYDFYGELLNPHQREIYEAFLFDDYSLAEIAADQKTSRQAVHDVIKRCNHLLLEYERKLHLLEKFLKIKGDVTRIHQLTKEQSSFADDVVRGEIASLSHQILEEL